MTDIEGTVVQLVDSSQPGGIETHIVNLSTALQNAAIPVNVIFLKDYGSHPMKDQLNRLGIPWLCLGEQGGFSALRKSRPLLIHTHGYKAGLVGKLFARLSRIPVVSTYHSGDPGRGRLRLYSWLDEQAARLAPAITVSAEISERLPMAALRINNFVEPPALPVTVTGQRIGFVGRLSDEKGPDLFCQLASKIPGVEAVVYGEGEMMAELEYYRGEKVHFAGFQSSIPWHELDLLCITSRHEGLPLAALEAMSYGVPVMAFSLGALPELIRDGENGWLIEPLNMVQFYDQLIQWKRLTASERLLISKAARQTVIDRYSPEAVLPLILALYANITGNSELAETSVTEDAQL